MGSITGLAAIKRTGSGRSCMGAVRVGERDGSDQDTYTCMKTSAHG